MSKGFSYHGYIHSRVPNKKLTDIVRDLDILVNYHDKYSLENNRRIKITYFDLWLKEDPMKFIWLIDARESNLFPYKGFVIHFKTGENLRKVPNKNILTESQKNRLFNSVSMMIPKGEILGSYGSITKGGISGMNKLCNYGFKIIDYYKNGLFLPEKTKISIPILQKQ